jgi:hypothetical protein
MTTITFETKDEILGAIIRALAEVLPKNPTSG